MTKISLSIDLQELMTELDKMNVKMPETTNMGGVFTQIIKISNSDDEEANEERGEST